MFQLESCHPDKFPMLALRKYRRAFSFKRFVNRRSSRCRSGPSLKISNASPLIFSEGFFIYDSYNPDNNTGNYLTPQRQYIVRSLQ